MSQRVIILIGLFLLIASPIAGGLIRGLPPEFCEFPPLTQYIRHAPFSWPVVGLFGVLEVLGFALLARPGWFGFRRETGNLTLDARRWRHAPQHRTHRSWFRPR